MNVVVKWINILNKIMILMFNLSWRTVKIEAGVISLFENTHSWGMADRIFKFLQE